MQLLSVRALFCLIGWESMCRSIWRLLILTRTRSKQTIEIGLLIVVGISEGLAGDNHHRHRVGVEDQWNGFVGLGLNG